MTLEGAIVQAGGFENIPEGASISEMVYVRLSGNEPPGEATDAETEPRRAQERAADAG